MNPDSITITINGVEHSITPKATTQQASKRPLLEGAKIGSKWKTRGGRVVTLHSNDGDPVYPWNVKDEMGFIYSVTDKGTEYNGHLEDRDIIAPMPEEAEKPSTSTPAVVVTINGVEYGPDKRLGDEYPYRPKVGDKVRFRPWDVLWGKDGVPFGFARGMRHLCGTTAIVKGVTGDRVCLSDFSATGDTSWSYSRQMLELVEEAPKPAEDPDIPVPGSYWKHKPTGIILIAAMTQAGSMDEWQLVSPKDGFSWKYRKGWDGDKAEFTPATRQDLIAYLQA